VPSPASELLPWGYPSLQRSINALTRVLLVRPSLFSLFAFARAPEVFAYAPSGQNLFRPSPSLGIVPPSEFLADSCRRPLWSGRLSWGFVPFGVIGPGSSLFTGLPRPLRSAFRFSQPPGGFLLPELWWPYFMPLTPVGFSLQSFPLSRNGSVSRRPLPSCRSSTAAFLPKKDDPR
jgi:hypothetical protein